MDATHKKCCIGQHCPVDIFVGETSWDDNNFLNGSSSQPTIRSVTIHKSFLKSQSCKHPKF